MTVTITTCLTTAFASAAAFFFAFGRGHVLDVWCRQQLNCLLDTRAVPQPSKLWPSAQVRLLITMLALYLRTGSFQMFLLQGFRSLVVWTTSNLIDELTPQSPDDRVRQDPCLVDWSYVTV